MLVSLVPIDNSKGIRIPNNILQQLDIEEKVELEVHNNEILLRPVKRKPREGWSEAFIRMRENGDDTLLIQNIEEKENFQWEW